MIKKLHAAAAAVAVTGLAGGALVLPAVTAEASTGKGVVSTRAGVPLSVNDAPKLKSNRTGWVRTGERITISCQVIGDEVRGPWGPNKIWDYIDGRGYVSDSWVNTGTNRRLAGVPDCGAKPGTPAKTPAPKTTTPATQKGAVVPLSQQTTLSTKERDCGPTSVVVALLKAGHTPRAWDAKNPAAAIKAARDATGIASGNTRGVHLRSALQANGAEASFTLQRDEALAAARAGRAVIFGGDSYTLNQKWSRHSGGGHSGHWIVIVGYDAKSDTYTVVDPNATEVSAKKISAAGLRDFFDTSRLSNPTSLGSVIVNS